MIPMPSAAWLHRSSVAGRGTIGQRNGTRADPGPETIFEPNCLKLRQLVVNLT
jgi:hypothetical protein